MSSRWSRRRWVIKETNALYNCLLQDSSSDSSADDGFELTNSVHPSVTQDLAVAQSGDPIEGARRISALEDCLHPGTSLLRNEVDNHFEERLSNSDSADEDERSGTVVNGFEAIVRGLPSFTHAIDVSQADESQEAVDRMSEIENYLDRDASLLINGGHGHIDDEQLQISHSGYEEERFGNVIGSFEPIYHGPPSFTHDIDMNPSDKSQEGGDGEDSVEDCINRETPLFTKEGDNHHFNEHHLSDASGNEEISDNATDVDSQSSRNNFSEDDGDFEGPINSRQYNEVDERQSSSDEDIPERVRRELARLKCRHNLSLKAVSDIAGIFRSTGIALPKDARTICLTDTTPLKNDDFVHFGLESGLREKLSHSPFLKDGTSNVKCQIFIDGLPPYRNSPKSLWPILCRITNHTNKTPFPVSCFYGKGKPSNLSAYLMPFIDEFNKLSENGISVMGKSFNVILDCIICDAEARSFVKAIKAHGGYGACERCDVKGFHLREENVRIFPDFHADLRTNESFRSFDDHRHHKGRSPLVEIPSLDMIYDFPLEYMHLVCLGVMRRLMTEVWLDTFPHCFSTSQKEICDKWIKMCNLLMPREFNRKGRSLSDIHKWKAVEFRTFLLYTGPIILKKVLSKEKYDHFLYFHAGIRVLASPSSTVEQKREAGNWLRFFASEFAKLYGRRHLVYCVHSLIHLANECVIHGSLDSFSAFPFESYLGRMKRLLRGTKLPLAQLKRRISELSHVEAAPADRNASLNEERNFGLSAIKENSKKDSYCIAQDGKIIQVTEICSTHVVGVLMQVAKDKHRNLVEFFQKPVPASSLDIYLIEGKGRKYTWPIVKFENCIKCVVLTLQRSVKVVFPLLHSYS